MNKQVNNKMYLTRHHRHHPRRHLLQFLVAPPAHTVFCPVEDLTAALFFLPLLLPLPGGRPFLAFLTGVVFSAIGSSSSSSLTLLRHVSHIYKLDNALCSIANIYIQLHYFNLISDKHRVNESAGKQ